MVSERGRERSREGEGGRGRESEREREGGGEREKEGERGKRVLGGVMTICYFKEKDISSLNSQILALKRENESLQLKSRKQRYAVL